MAHHFNNPSPIPEIHLLCLLPSFAEAFNDAVAKYFPSLHSHIKLTTHTGRLERLASDLHFSAIVSPANSYGRLDGAFDDAISKMLSPSDDYNWVTRKAQSVLYQKWRGFAPPGTCTVIPLAGEGEGEKRRELKWGTKYILLCPTMRTPAEVRWDREVVYECVWSLLCAVSEHNGNVGADQKIESILMTPLATGVGRVSYERWAGQCVLAIKHYIDAMENPEKWSGLEWEHCYEYHEETQKTYADEI